VERDLKGKPFERLVRATWDGIELQPLYTEADAPPSQAPVLALAGAADPWAVLTEQGHPDPAEANRALRADLERGADGVLLRLQPGGLGPDGLEAALAGVDLGRAWVGVDAGPEVAAAGGVLRRLWTGVAEPRGALEADPIGTFARGRLAGPLDAALKEMVALATEVDAPGVTPAAVDASLYGEAGAGDALELAGLLATGVAYLRGLDAAGLDPAAATARIRFTVGLGRELHPALAKLRAVRLLWARVLEAAGADATTPMRLHARTYERLLSRRDPWVNMVRATAAGLAAAVGGAGSVTLLPFDAALGLPGELGRRVARNAQLILRAESHLDRIRDPARGSYLYEALTRRLAEEAWGLFQAIEGEGGAAEALRSGWLQARVRATRADRAEAAARRKAPIVGVSAYPDLEEAPVAVEPAPAPPPLGAGEVPAEPLRPWRPAAPFEALRDRSDAHLAAAGARPRAFLASLGPLAEHTARTAWTTSLLAAGGVAVAGAGDYGSPAEAAAAYGEAGAPAVAVICSSDARSAEEAEAAARGLKEAGARTVLLAGRPGEREEAWRAAGVDGFVHMGVDVLAALERVLTDLGVAA